MPKPNLRDPLIASGMRTLHQSGFNGCSVQDIARAAGAPKGSFYNHFESKEGLALAALDLFWSKGSAGRAALQERDQDPVERLRQHFRQLADALGRAEYANGCMIGNFSAEMSGHSEFRTRLSQILAEWAEALEACIADAKAAGRLRVETAPSTLAAFLVNAWEGAILRAKVERNRAALDDFETVVFAGLFT